MNKDNEFKPVFFNDINNPFELQSNGTIIPNLTLKGQMKIFKDITRFKVFSVRDAYSKAANRAQRRVLNQEFQDEIEIDLENEEVERVNKGKKVKKEPVQYKSKTHSFAKTPERNTDELAKQNDFEADNDVQDFKEDLVATNWVKIIIKNLNIGKRQINRTNMGRELIDLAKDPDNEINDDLLTRIKTECEKRKLKDLRKEK